MELSNAKHQEYLRGLENRVRNHWNRDAARAHKYEVEADELGRFLFYKKNRGSEERTQIATIDLTGAGGTMQQNANASKDLDVLKTSACYMCHMLNDSNPNGRYKLTFTGPDAEAIKAYVEIQLRGKALIGKFNLEVGRTQPARPSVLAKDLSAPSASRAASQKAVAGRNKQRPPSPRGF